MDRVDLTLSGVHQRKVSIDVEDTVIFNQSIGKFSIAWPTSHQCYGAIYNTGIRTYPELTGVHASCWCFLHATLFHYSHSFLPTLCQGGDQGGERSLAGTQSSELTGVCTLSITHDCTTRAEVGSVTPREGVCDAHYCPTSATQSSQE